MDSIDINSVVVSVILSLISSVATGIMAGIWSVMRALKSQKKDLNVAFTKIRNLEKLNGSGDGKNSDEPSLEGPN